MQCIPGRDVLLLPPAARVPKGSGLGSWFSLGCVAKTSLFFSLTVWVWVLYKQKLLKCPQCSVPEEPSALGQWHCLQPHSPAGQLLLVLPTRLGRGEEHTGNIKGDTSPCQADFGSFFSPVFLAGAEGDATNGHLNLLLVFFCWCTAAPILSLHSRVLSAVWPVQCDGCVLGLC